MAETPRDNAPAIVPPLKAGQTELKDAAPIIGVMRCFSMCNVAPDCVLPTPWPPAPVP